MSESILNALVQLFALIGDIHDETVITSREKDIVRMFLARQLNNELVTRYMRIFEEYLKIYNSERFQVIVGIKVNHECPFCLCMNRRSGEQEKHSKGTAKKQG